MRAPDPPPSPRAREAAAVAEAVKLIRSAVGTEGSDEITEFGEEAHTAFMVRSVVNAMQELFATLNETSPFGNRRQNRHILGDAVRHVQALQDTLKKLPAGVKALIFSREYEGRNGFYFVNLAVKSQKAGPRLYNFVVALQDLRSQCAFFGEDPPGETAAADFPSRIAARCAAEILEYWGLQPTRGNDAKASIFEQLASLLHEAATGEVGKDFRHACREEINRRKAQS